MTNRYRYSGRIGVGLCLASLVAAPGCGYRPARVAAPDWSPRHMAESAISELDTSSDGEIDSSEILQAPGLADAFELLDTNGSGSLSVDELQARLEFYKKMKTAFVRTSIAIRMDGRPMANTFVRLMPEAFQGESVLPASGITDHLGNVSPKTEGKPYPAMQPGFYRVELYSDSAGQEPIAVRQALGIESSPQSHPGRDSVITLDFKRG